MSEFAVGCVGWGSKGLCGCSESSSSRGPLLRRAQYLATFGRAWDWLSRCSYRRLP